MIITPTQYTARSHFKASTSPLTRKKWYVQRVMRFEHGHNKRMNEGPWLCFIQQHPSCNTIKGIFFLLSFFPNIHVCILGFHVTSQCFPNMGFQMAVEKPTHPLINTGANSAMNQSEFLAITYNFAANYFCG